MSFPASPRRQQLVRGVALLGCSLASTAAFGGGGFVPLNFTTVNSFTGTMTAGSTSFTYTLPAASSGFLTGAPGTSSAIATAYGSSYDLFQIALDSEPSSYTSATGSGTISLTFSADVTFLDFGLLVTGVSCGWEYGGFAVTNGQLFVASGSPYVFNINYTYAGVATDYFASTAAFSLAAPAIPLPGAAGLAACGLLGLRRRRR